MKKICCNKCGKEFTNKVADNSRIICPHCNSNESLSIRPTRAVPGPIQEYLEELEFADS